VLPLACVALACGHSSDNGGGGGNSSTGGGSATGGGTAGGGSATGGGSAAGGGSAIGGGAGGGIVNPCDGGLSVCDGTCVDTSSDDRHCGTCVNVCHSDQACTAGTCTKVCDPGQTNCSEQCFDLHSDPDHCGDCNTACTNNHVCENGGCQCMAGNTDCSGACVDLQTDHGNCSTCGKACGATESCVSGMCVPNCTVAGQRFCGTACTDVTIDIDNCGQCRHACPAGAGCSAGACSCPGGATVCFNSCTDTKSDDNNCGACGNTCPAGEQCVMGQCQSYCPAGLLVCPSGCVDLANDVINCGGCGTRCGFGQTCTGGACVACSSSTTDCDHDGWTVADGDCCDSAGGCLSPAQVNPGAIELPFNGVDDNCNGLLDYNDTLDLSPCDSALLADSGTPLDYVNAMGLCRTTVENPAQLKDKTWGIIDAQLLHADGTQLDTPQSKSIRPNFGKLKPREGTMLAVFSSGLAADEQQTDPGPNGGPFSDPSTDNLSQVDISTCTLPHCIIDWYSTPNLPLKPANDLPQAPNCGGGGFGDNISHDSVMLLVRMRVPTNVNSFSVSSYFLSAEYPEFVCTAYNDQVVLLVDTLNATPLRPNPVDKNLLTYSSSGALWPIGINLAGGTGLFRVCDSQAVNPSCWYSTVSSLSCGEGSSGLALTGFEADSSLGSTACTTGGGTDWLNTNGNVQPGGIVELRFVIWDVGDGILDSSVLFDNFKWNTQVSRPGTGG
jgi:hypothetical protein